MTEPARWVAIINPRSRAGSSARTLARLIAELGDAAVTVLVSEHAGHVDALVRESSSADGIIVAGGDGTLFEVLQACDRARQRIALLPFGRGNSLAKDLGLRTPMAAMHCIRSGVDRCIDLLSVTLRFDDGGEWRGVSASNLAIGYPAQVAKGASRWRRFGGFSYAIAAVLARPRAIELRASPTDNQQWLTGVVISNSKHVGPFVGFPTANLADGMFHVMEMRAGALRQALHSVSSLTGVGFYEPVVVRECTAVHIALAKPTLVKIDGELRDGVRDISVQIVPNAVTFRVPTSHA